MSNRHDTESDRQKMSEASHTNPYTDESFGETVAYSRGRVVAADGGRANAEKHDDATIADMDHTPRRGAPDTNAVNKRGEEDA
jgi:hypothetical protein